VLILKKYQIIDNFLSSGQCENIISSTIKNTSFPLFLKNGVSGKDVNDGIYFTHCFFEYGKVNSTFFQVLNPILEKIEYSKMIRIQLNLYPKTSFIKKHEYHVDYNFSHKGLIYYLNTNNGKTILKGKFKNHSIKSVKNRSLIFNPNEKHQSTTCTNDEFRSNIIFNYI